MLKKALTLRENSPALSLSKNIGGSFVKVGWNQLKLAKTIG